MSKDFIHLHNHTHSSMLDGYSKYSEYIEAAKRNGQRGLGVTDHGNLYELAPFLREARANDLLAVPGAELYVAPENPDGAFHKSPVYYDKNGPGNPHDVSSKGAYLHLTVWAYNEVGLNNLFNLSTLSFDVDRFYHKPRIDFNLLADHSEGLIVATGCPSSEISTRLLLGQDKEAYEYAGRLKEVFGSNLYVEIMDHDMDIDLERKLLPKQVQLAKKMGIPLIATNDSHYAYQSDHVSHEEMLCVQSNSKMTDPTYDEGGNRFAFNGNEFYLRGSDEMTRLFPDSEFPNATKNTLIVAEQASDVKLEFNPHLKPVPKVPAEFKDEVEYYKHLLKEGYKWRYGNASPEVRREAIRRSKHEFEVIHSGDFIGYMLVVRDYLNWFKEKYSTRDAEGNIIAQSTGPGRGSSGGSVNAYMLGIIDVDPIKYDLIFQRFLSEGRGATYELTYDDGTVERVVVSEKKNLDNGDTKYIHQLEIGDTVIDEKDT